MSVVREFNRKRLYLNIFVFVVIGLGLYFFTSKYLISWVFYPNDESTEIGITRQDVELISKNESVDDVMEPPVRVIEKDLQIPWEVVFLVDGSMLVIERIGNLLRISPDYKHVIKVEGVEHIGEGGLLGMALHPDFSQNHWIYLYLTSQEEDGLVNRLERYDYDLDQNQLKDRVVILGGLKGAIYHDGGRIAFGPDGYLYVTVGDAQETNLAQDTGSLNGKILRIKDDGSIPEDNPFGNAIWSYGHRNPQGLAWDSQGRLWSSEHGPSGNETGYDEINLIIKGGNYGWPVIKGDESKAGMILPVIQSGSSATWAPGGLVIVDDMLFFPGLRGESLYSARISGDELVDLKANFKRDYGRLRTVVLGPDGWLYMTTSNTDGRGEPIDSDDRLIKVSIELFK